MSASKDSFNWAARYGAGTVFLSLMSAGCFYDPHARLAGIICAAAASCTFGIALHSALNGMADAMKEAASSAGKQQPTPPAPGS
jgi:hypothetical protein